MNALFVWVDHAERRLCVLANTVSRRRFWRPLFQVVSRLGDGAIWYLLMATMPLLMGLERWREGAWVSLQMLAASALGLLLYKYLKKKLVRERPFVGLIGIECAMAPLDRYSFPSGHTLHAVLFTVIAVRHVPELALILVPFAALVAASRVILGLHYPTDVVAGAALGALIAVASESAFH